MDIRELNRRRIELGKRPINDSPEFDQYGFNLWKREDGAWVIASEDGRGNVVYTRASHDPPQGDEHGATIDVDGILTFDSKNSACDYLWRLTTRPSTPPSGEAMTPAELEANRASQEARYEAAVREYRKHATVEESRHDDVT